MCPFSLHIVCLGVNEANIKGGGSSILAYECLGDPLFDKPDNSSAIAESSSFVWLDEDDQDLDRFPFGIALFIEVVRRRRLDKLEAKGEEEEEEEEEVKDGEEEFEKDADEDDKERWRLPLSPLLRFCWRYLPTSSITFRRTLLTFLFVVAFNVYLYAPRLRIKSALRICIARFAESS